MRLRLVSGAGISLSDSGYGRLKKLPSGGAKFAKVGVGVNERTRLLNESEKPETFLKHKK